MDARLARADRPRGFGAPRARHACALAGLVVGLLLALPSAAMAAPRATAVDGFYGDGGVFSDYVTLRVQTRGATTVHMEWPGHGGACARTSRRGACRASRRSSIASVDFGFHNCRFYGYNGCRGAARRYTIRVDACRRGRCRSRIFRGEFKPQEG